MSRALIIYGTTDGHTRKIADVLAETFRSEHWDVVLRDARDVGPRDSPDGCDRVIVAASIHAGGYQRAVKRWVRAHAQHLNHTHSAFLSVCLGILEPRPEARHEVREIMERFLHRSGWEPSVAKTVAGAVPYTRYSWLKKWVMKRIAAKSGGGTDTTRDYEYTDWDDLRAFARQFARTLSIQGRAVAQGAPVPAYDSAMPAASSAE
jgi:menaquinone-dependent protoporphyrinogen oxidase